MRIKQSPLLIFSALLAMTISSAVLPTATSAAVVSSGSYNWSGYEATSGDFTGVTGTWTVPVIPDATSTKADVTWIGIGGVTTSDLIQAGTQALINGSGTAAYQAWYELLPSDSQYIPLAVSPGDSLTVSIVEATSSPASSIASSSTASSSPSFSTPTWTVYFDDNTSGQTYETQLNYASSFSSAEWIEEMPSDSNGLIPLDDFGAISFTDALAIENGTQITIAGADGVPLTMLDQSSTILAAPSILGPDGASFVVARAAGL